MASRLGTVREVVGRTLRSFAAAGLIEFDRHRELLTVNSRRKEKKDGPWMADARWGDKNDPKAKYEIRLDLSKGGVKG